MTHFHAKYFAHSLTLKRSSGDIKSLSRSIANARVDLNPHQVHAALFALKSPLSMGAILADEVGLGKTIEAGLVIAQKWAERKRHILLIVPAFLRKQWEQELLEKFYLKSLVLDSKTFREKQKDGSPNPFCDTHQVLICSYQFAAKNDTCLAEVPWDLVVIDEAHRLRNIYKNSNKQAKAITEALKDRPKILLTATPLQNNLMELYGLVSVIDPILFGDADSFKGQYVLCKDEELRNHCLKKRLEPVVVRTLRKQVMEYVSFTERVALTQDFYPTDDEQKLYEGVSAYLQKEHLYSLPKGRRQLITLILRKLLASSPEAITATLKKLLNGLEKQAGPDAILDEEEIELLESLENDWNDEDCQKVEVKDSNPNEQAKKQEIKEEILELRGYIELAEKIKRNTKSEALLIALEQAFLKTEELGAAKKAVIFTESRRTQKFLYDFLSQRGFEEQLVCISGSNTDLHSKDIYESWVKEHQDSDKLTGSKPVDIKAALVDHFKNQATILIATEAAAEGVNLQFCSLIINYDLPWNPQKVEQRIGRCHRYGQKHDVVVVNFINKRNEADQRVYELLKDKFKLFDGVFGASDDILGSIESGVDIENRIAEVYQTCRSSEEIQQAFEQIRAELDLQIQENLQKTKRNIFEHLDEDVTTLLRMQRDKTEISLDEREKLLFQLVEAELKDKAQIDWENFSFILADSSGISKKYFLNWKQADIHEGIFFRDNHPLAEQLIAEASSRTLNPSHVIFNYTNYRKKISSLEGLLGIKGWLEVDRLTIDTFEQEEFLLLYAKKDDGTCLAPEIVQKFFSLPAHVHSIINPMDLPQTIPKENYIHGHLDEVEKRAGAFYDMRVEQIESWSEDLKLSLEKEIKDLDKEIKESRGLAKSATSLSEKLAHQKQIRDLENKRNIKRQKLFTEQDRIEQERDKLIERLEGDLKPKTKITPVFALRWEIQ